MIGFDAVAVASEFRPQADEVPVLLLAIGMALPTHWPRKRWRAVEQMLSLV